MQNIINFLKFHLIEMILGIIILILLVVVFLTMNNKVDAKEVVSEQVAYVKEEKEVKKIRVDLKGAVKKEGIFKVDEDSTIDDVIKLSGGLKKDAITKNINLAKKVYDEMVIYVSSKGDIKKIDNCYKEVIDENPIASKDIYVNDYNNSSLDNNKEESDNLNSLININTASKDELLSISGLGESKVLAIIAYRENTPFKTIEDIKNVSGIKDSLFNKIKDYITV